MSSPSFELTPEVIRSELAAAGFRFELEELRLESREERWLVRLPQGRVAWFAASDRGRQRLAIERRVLRLLESRCSFSAPRVIFEHGEGDFDLRVMVPGGSDPWVVYERALSSAEFAASIGRAVAEILVEQHTKIEAGDLAGWLPPLPSWPEPRVWISERLGDVIDDPQLLLAANDIMQKYEAVNVADADRVLVHADLGFHNLAIAPESGVVNGVFDYDGAAYADRHHDFRYLLFDVDSLIALDAATELYESKVGYRIERGRVFLYNAACAVSFLAYRHGTAPTERSAGRTLAEDLNWTRLAIARVKSAAIP